MKLIKVANSVIIFRDSDSYNVRIYKFLNVLLAFWIHIQPILNMLSRFFFFSIFLSVLVSIDTWTLASK